MLYDIARRSTDVNRSRVSMEDVKAQMESPEIVRATNLAIKQRQVKAYDEYRQMCSENFDAQDRMSLGAEAIPNDHSTVAHQIPPAGDRPLLQHDVEQQCPVDQSFLALLNDASNQVMPGDDHEEHHGTDTELGTIVKVEQQEEHIGTDHVSMAEPNSVVDELETGTEAAVSIDATECTTCQRDEVAADQQVNIVGPETVNESG